MVTAKALIKFLEAINEDTKICVSVADASHFTFSEIVEVTYNSEGNILIIRLRGCVDSNAV